MGDVVALVIFYDGWGDAESVCVAIKWTGRSVVKTFEYYIRAIGACKCIFNDEPASWFRLGCLGV